MLATPPKIPVAPPTVAPRAAPGPPPAAAPIAAPEAAPQSPPAKPALDGIIRVCAGREAQHQSGDYAGRNSGHTAFPQVVDRVQPTTARRIFAPFLATNPGMRLENPGQAATGKRPPAASLVLRFHDAQDAPQAEREQTIGRDSSLQQSVWSAGTTCTIGVCGRNWMQRSCARSRARVREVRTFSS